MVVAVPVSNELLSSAEWSPEALRIVTGSPAMDTGSQDRMDTGSQARMVTASPATGTGQGSGGGGGGAKFPRMFAICVYVDSVMDGLLVGLALVTGNSAGLFMAVAMAVEMGFLGLTFATACSGQPLYIALPAVISGPLLLVCGSALGGVVANSLAENEAARVGCTAFGVAALLYTVCEELLVSAHEEADSHVWWVDIQVFVGFLLALVIGKAVLSE